MIDIVAYILILFILVGFWAWNLLIIRHRTYTFHENSSDILYDDSDTNPIRNPDVILDTSMFNIVLRTLGWERYVNMTYNINKFLKKHKNNECYKVSLSKDYVGVSYDGANILHHLLPGDKVSMIRIELEGRVGFRVFSCGREIGILMDDDAKMTNRIMNNAVVTGMYVWKQNCYGNCGYTDLDIVMFFYFKRNVLPLDWLGFPYIIKFGNPIPYFVFQN
ncbi:MAG: hypothetical protein K2F94_06765 [Muribaculaceae bacterium]|nr:hypothetical protein [Muribaculaceae bacterium]